MRWLESWLTGKGGPTGLDAARKLLGSAGIGARVAVVAPDDAVVRLAADCLELLAPEAHVDRMASAEVLALMLPRLEFDLVVLHGSQPMPPGAMPRPEIVRIGPGGLPLDDADATGKLAQAVARGLSAVTARRAAATERFDASAQLPPAEAARVLVECYRSGDLAGAAREALKGRLEAVLPKLDGEDLAAARLVAIANHHDRLDEQGLIYHANLLKKQFPAHAAEADAWLARANDLAEHVYALIDEELEAATVQRRLGNHRRVLDLSEAILDRLANVLPALQLRADALRMTGRLNEAIAAYRDIADACLRDGEVERFYQMLRTIGALDLTGEHAELLTAARERAQRLEEELSSPQARPRYPVLHVCSHALCRDVAEGSRGFYCVDPDLVGCDVCGTEPATATVRSALAGRTIAVIGGRLHDATEKALMDLGMRRALCHPDPDDARGVPLLLDEADAVVLVTGSSSHAATIKAYRELARRPLPHARVHFYGPRQIARAVSKDLAAKLAAKAPI